jgi:predicted small integral membrane protein
MLIVRLCKTAMVASLALFFTVVAFGNITDYGSNWEFVRHVLAMDTIFPDSTLRWRAVTNETLQTTAYIAIIATEAVTALLLWLGAARMLAAAPGPSFSDAKVVAVTGLTLGFLLYAAGFVTIGGEWFAMWQSSTWNGEAKAFQFMAWIAGVMVIVLVPEEGRSGPPQADA